MGKFNLEIQRVPELMRILGYKSGDSPSSVYKQIDEGLLPPPFKLYGERASAFLAHETTLVMAARAIGKTDEEIRGLVSSLVKQRQEFFDSLMQGVEQKGNPITNECRHSLVRLEHSRREHRYLMLPKSSDALDDAADKLQIAADVIESETSRVD